MNHPSREAASGRARRGTSRHLDMRLHPRLRRCGRLGPLAAAATATPGRVPHTSNIPERGVVPASPAPMIVPTPTDTTPPRSSS
jgi:hypothetical protein